MIRIQDEIDPQIRMATPKGDFHLAMQLPGSEREREALLARLKVLMAWKQVLGFTWACELFEPDAVYCAGVFGREQHAALMRIERSPRPWRAGNFGAVEWLPSEAIDPALAALRPSGPVALTPAQVSECQRWFGPDGKFPAVHMDTGELRDV
ncbi:MAG: hypothetical protein KDJ36_08785 [Hyphomicrobiaceae bacterium]|nr:hypothetical protein [Hyphomicrobiaceae bacterium]